MSEDCIELPSDITEHENYEQIGRHAILAYEDCERVIPELKRDKKLIFIKIVRDIVVGGDPRRKSREIQSIVDLSSYQWEAYENCYKRKNRDLEIFAQELYWVIFTRAYFRLHFEQINDPDMVAFCPYIQVSFDDTRSYPKKIFKSLNLKDGMILSRDDPRFSLDTLPVVPMLSFHFCTLTEREMKESLK